MNGLDTQGLDRVSCTLQACYLLKMPHNFQFQSHRDASYMQTAAGLNRLAISSTTLNCGELIRLTLRK